MQLGRDNMEYQFSINDFEGPLDLLLHLVKTSKMNIYDINIKIIVFIIFCFPVFLLSISGVHGENILYILIYIFNFIFKQKLFFYSKTNKYR